MKKFLVFALLFTLPATLSANIHVEAEDCSISSWNLAPSEAVVRIAVPLLTDVNAVEIVGGRSDATGVGQLRLPAAIPDDEYAVVLRYYTNRTYAGSNFGVQFGAYSGTVVKYATSTDWHMFYPNNSSASWYTWYDLELTPSGCPFPTSPTEPLPPAIGIYGVAEGDFYINIWDKTSSAYDLATVDYIELVPVPPRASDMDNDGYVNFKDLKLLVDNWLDYEWQADIYPLSTGDGIIDMADYASFADDWRKAALHVADITSQAVTIGCDSGHWSAEFVVTVKDKRQDPIENVQVTSQWSGVHGAEGITTETTDSNGQAFFISQCRPISGDATLTVTDLYKKGHAYNENENIETSATQFGSVPWHPIVRAEDWLIDTSDGYYDIVDSPLGLLVIVSTDSAGNSEYSVGDLKFNFPGTIPNGNYRLTIHWRSATVNGTPWAFKLGSDSGTLTEYGVTTGKWHYFYPGHSGPQSNQWFTHDLAGSNPINFSMWPNSPVAAYITVSGISQGDLYIRIWDMSPSQNNYFMIDYFELTPLP
ncbi:MAG: Ig-like domain-containing protein [Planctomycetota bacterium]